MSQACPTCGRPWRRAKRTCASCDKPILKHHKWHFDGSQVRHDNCANPELRPPKEGPLLQDQSMEDERGNPNSETKG